MPGSDDTTREPWIVEKARSGRSRCKACRRPIALGKWRVGRLVEGPFGPGYLWHHLSCAARRYPDEVRQLLERESDRLEGLPTPDELAREAERRSRSQRERPEPPYVEIAPTGRSKCRACGRPIAEGSVRLVLVREVTFGNQTRRGDFKAHPECAAAALADPECASERDDLDERLAENRAGLDPQTLEQAREAVRRALTGGG